MKFKKEAASLLFCNHPDEDRSNRVRIEWARVGQIGAYAILGVGMSDVTMCKMNKKAWQT